MTITLERPALGSAAEKFLKKDHKIFIDGKWVTAKSGKTFPVEDPATEEIIATCRRATRRTSTWRLQRRAALSKQAHGRE